MVYIEKAKVLNNTYAGNKLKRGAEFEFSSVNLFVGNQGCGKSTMLQMLRSSYEDLELTFSEYLYENDVESFYFDTELGNPRIKDIDSFSNADGSSKRGFGIKERLVSSFMSHGEVMQEFIINPIRKANINCVILLDEPESGLSLTNQYILIKEIKEAVKRGCQFFIATHCYPLIREFDVISLEHNQQMKGIDFIKKIENKYK